MKSRDEFYTQLVHLIDTDLHTIGVKIKHYHADGGAELISKVVIKKLQLEGSRYTWTPADTPELNSTSERKWRTLGEMSLSMLLRSGLPVDFWWDAYETATYITIRLPTTTARGYMTPWEAVYGVVPDISNIRVWGCKTYLKVPRNYIRKDWREKVFSGYLMGYSTIGEVGYKIYVPDFQEIITGVNCTFNELIPPYTEEYFNEINKLRFETAVELSKIEDFAHLIGKKYRDTDMLEYMNTRIAEYKGYIVVFRAPVLENRTGREEKSPIHVADVVRLMDETEFHNRVDVILNTHETGHSGSKTHDGTMGGNKVSTSQMGESRR